MSFSQNRPERAPVSAARFNTCVLHHLCTGHPCYSQTVCGHSILPGTHGEVLEGNSLQLQEIFADRGVTLLGISKCLDWSAPAQPCLLSGCAGRSWRNGVCGQLAALQADSATNSCSHIKGRMSKAILKGLEKVKHRLGCSQGASQGGYWASVPLEGSQTENIATWRCLSTLMGPNSAGAISDLRPVLLHCSGRAPQTVSVTLWQPWEGREEPD